MKTLILFIYFFFDKQQIKKNPEHKEKITLSEENLFTTYSEIEINFVSNFCFYNKLFLHFSFESKSKSKKKK